MPIAAELIAETIASVSDSTAIQRAQDRDAFVRDFDRKWGDWFPVADCAVSMERDKDWHLLGFTSFDHYLMVAAPRSKSYIRLVMSHHKELSVDLSPEDLAQVRLGSAGILRQLPHSLRRDPEVQREARKAPQDFRKSLGENHPEQRIEEIVTIKLNFPLSLWSVISQRFEIYQLTDETATMVDFIEYLITQESE